MYGGQFLHELKISYIHTRAAAQNLSFLALLCRKLSFSILTFRVTLPLAAAGR